MDVIYLVSPGSRADPDPISEPPLLIMEEDLPLVTDSLLGSVAAESKVWLCGEARGMSF